MQMLYKKNLINFIKNCRFFYKNKKIEIIRIFEINTNNNQIYIGEEIIIPRKNIITKTGGVSISVKFLNDLCFNLSRQKKGFLIIHNHDTQCIPSITDESTFGSIKKFIDYYYIYPSIFSIYSNDEIYFRIINNREDEEEFKIKQNILINIEKS